MSVQDSVRNFIKNSEGPVTVQKIIEKTPGDYNEVAFAVKRSDKPVYVGSKKIGNKGRSIALNKIRNILGNPGDSAIPQQLQKKLGQSPSDTDIDDFDDALKILGPSNVRIGKKKNNMDNSNFEGSLPGPNPDTEKMKSSAKKLKNLAEQNSSVIVVLFFILGAIGISIGPFDFE